MSVSSALLTVNIAVLSLLCLLLQKKPTSQSISLTEIFSTILIVIGYFIAGDTVSAFAFISGLSEIAHLVEVQSLNIIGEHYPAAFKASCAVGVSFYLAVKDDIAGAVLLFIGGALILGVLLLLEYDEHIYDNLDKEIVQLENKAETVIATDLRKVVPSVLSQRSSASTAQTTQPKKSVVSTQSKN
jgi:hypothetical protein